MATSSPGHSVRGINSSKVITFPGIYPFADLVAWHTVMHMTRLPRGHQWVNSDVTLRQ